MHSDTLRSLSSLRYNRSPNSPYTTSALFWHFWTCSVLVSSYLYNKTHAVTINSLQSEHTTLHYGVPQGSILGPVLFILYTQPPFNLVSKHAVNHHAFADDNQLHKISTLDAIHQSIETLQNCTTDVKSWMTANKLQLNDNKTEAMIILSNRMSVHSPLPSVIHIGDADVPFVSSVKNFGVTLDSNLSMSQHISNHTYKSGI